MAVADAFGLLTMICIGLQAYHYVGYPMAVIGLARLFGKERAAGAPAPRPQVNLVVCAFNEAGVIAQKIENSLALDYPHFDVIVVADGSTDGTERIAERWSGGPRRLRVLFEPTRRGKSEAMNRGAAAATGEILVFSDANAFYRADALRRLILPFADPRVAVVSGHKTVRAAGDGAEGSALGASDGGYWSYEARLRDAESRLGATVATVGEMLAVRRDDWRPLPPGTINDDAYVAMTNLSRGRDVRFAADALSSEAPAGSSEAERRRRRRINAGRIQLLAMPGVWPWRRPAVLLAFVSHKVLRLALPLLLVTGLVANLATVALAPAWNLFALLLAGHLALLALVAAGFVSERRRRPWRLAHLAYHVVGSSLTVFGAFADVLSGRRTALWEKADR
jgi:cellulose synthase/poly-beta-1,6-N-acetylglucosamine synthase-like glycosyltransferase